MAGLLGDYTPDPLAQGLLGLGSALLTPRQMGGGLAAGAQAFNQGAMQAQMMRRQMAQDALRRQLIDAQIGEIGAQAKQREAVTKAAEARAQQEAETRARQDSVWDVLRGGPAAVAAQTGNLAPTKANAALLGQPPQITPQLVAQAAAAGIPLDTLRGVVQSGDWTKRKAVREVTVKGPDGSPRTILVDEFGQPVGDGFDQPVKREMLNTGNAFTPINPYTQSGALPINMSPAERDASARGWAGVRNSQDRLAFEKSQAGSTADKWVNDLERGIQINMATGETRPMTSGGQPVGPRGQTSTQQRVTDANDAIALIDQAERLIDKSTGSFLGTGIDLAARGIGVATPGAQAGAQLRALEGALISKMPKMSGPQSDKDVLLYKQMAGQIGDPTIPAATKKAALQTIREIQNRYAGNEPAAPAAAASPTNLQELARQELARRAAGNRGGASGSF